ncbi:DUF5009 domain-containing protein [Burkholderiaceae bacterium DAT-1]|nr:DUF5009 domain-containing protein [Burkholderiaceae bacterium DAT-1]
MQSFIFAAHGRQPAIDACRALTMALMLFINQLAGVKGMPDWMHHMPAHVDGMTWPDVIFPAFLFISGLSMPLSLQQQVIRGASIWQLQLDQGKRALALIVMGLFMVNAEEGFAAIGINLPVWNVLSLICLVLIWGRLHAAAGHDATPAWARPLGISGLLILFAIYRGGPDGNLPMQTSWWGILGLIGWAGCLSAQVYLAGRGRILPMLLAMAGCVLIYAVLECPALSASPGIRALRTQSLHCAHVLLVLAGIVTTRIALSELPARAKRVGLFAFALLCLVAAVAVHSIYPISKIHATPSWALYCAAICIAVFALIQAVTPLSRGLLAVPGMRRLAQVPLLAYLIPFFVEAGMQVTGVNWPVSWMQGGVGVMCSVVFVWVVAGVAAGLTRVGIKVVV